MTGIKLVIAIAITGLIAVVVGLPAQTPAMAREAPAALDQSGPLCCASGVCVEWSGSSCSGVLGWSEYALEVDADTGITHAERGQP